MLRGIFALKILQHMSERSEFVLQNLWFLRLTTILMHGKVMSEVNLIKTEEVLREMAKACRRSKTLRCPTADED